MNKKEEVLENIFDDERLDDNIFTEEIEKRKKEMDKPAQNRIQKQEDNIFDGE